MKPLLFITIISTLVACGQNNSLDKLGIKKFRYAAFLWHKSPDNDNVNFYLAHYIDIDKDGHFKLMRRDSFMSTPQYFEGTLSNNLRKIIDTPFIKETYKTDYHWNINDNIAYNAFTYAIDFKKADTTQLKRIYFIPNKAPSEINQLASKLDSLIFNTNNKAIDTMDTYSYEEELKRDYIKKYGQLPKVYKEKPKFRQ